MIFVLHYLLFNVGLMPIIILLTLFLQTYSDASLSEIGALLMALPFVSIFIKPLFCALADRQQAHKLYLMIALGLMALGYGSLVIAPFFPDFISQHGRTVWYLDIVGIVIGNSAFGLIWSLGDALAVNHAQMSGVTWGAYRVWGVVAWGIGGVLMGQINEVSFLPKYVPAMFVLLTALTAEIVILALWPNKHFVMGGSLEKSQLNEEQQQNQTNDSKERQQQMRELDDEWSTANRSLTGTLTGTARADPRMIGAVANIFMEDIGGTLRSSLKLGAKPKRVGLDEILEQHQVETIALAKTSSGATNKVVATKRSPLAGAFNDSNNESQHSGDNSSFRNSTSTPIAAHNISQTSDKTSTSFSRATLRRTQLALAPMNSLSAASGHAISNELTFNISRSDSISTPSAMAGCASNQQQIRQQMMFMSSLTSQASLSKAAAARALGMNGNIKSSPLSVCSGVTGAETGDTKQPDTDGLNQSIAASVPDGQASYKIVSEKPKANVVKKQLRSPDDLQLVLLKLIIRRDTSIWKYMVMFTIFGALLFCHLSYFFVHLEHLCRQKGSDFSTVTGGMMAAHSISEVFSFTIVVPYFIPFVGRSGSLLSCAIIYACRFAYYGTYLDYASPYTGIPFELAHGIVYGIVYSLITDIACECVNQVDSYFPELIDRGVIDSSIDPSRVKLQLRATMQGLFSGAFDGLGNGIGALLGGLFLDAYPFTYLWRFCTCVCLVTAVIYSISEWRTLFKRSNLQATKS